MAPKYIATHKPYKTSVLQSKIHDCHFVTVPSSEEEKYSFILFIANTRIFAQKEILDNILQQKPLVQCTQHKRHGTSFCLILMQQ